MKILASKIGPYNKDDQVQMCIAQGPTFNPADNTYYFWLIDIGDGWSSP